MPAARFARFDGPEKPFEVLEQPLPARLGDGEVLVAIDLATICGSDLHTMKGRRTAPTPCILGHEGVGRIVALGPGRASWHTGDRVTWTLADSCGGCAACTEFDLPQKCARLFKYGHAGLSDGDGLNGCYASHIVLRSGTHLVRVPDPLSDAVAAPANCALSTMISATESLPEPCRVAVVQGAGLLGLYACALLRAKGVRRVIIVDTDPKRLELAPEFGGETALRSAATLIGPGEADAVFEVAGVPMVVPEGIQLLRPGGFYAFVGMVHPESALNITGEAIIRRCLTIRGFHNYAPRHLDAAIAFLLQHQSCHPWKELVSPAWPLTRLNEAFAEAGSHRWHRVAVSPGG